MIAIRTLENRGQIHQFLADRARATGDKAALANMIETAESAKRDMELIKEVMNRL